MWISKPVWQMGLVVILTVSLVGVCLFTAQLAKTHRAELGSYLFLSIMMLVLGANVVLIAGLISVLALAYAGTIVTAGMLLGPKGGWFTAFTGALLWGLVKGITELTAFPQADMTGTLFTIAVLVITVATLLFVAFMSQLATQDLRRALDDATYDLVQANRKLGEANRLKSQFLARTSHELRTPLNAIIGYTDLTLRRVYGSLTAMQDDGLKRVLSNAKRLQALINDILDLSKIEAGEMELIASPFNTQSLVEAVDVAVGEDARKKGLEFSVSLAPDMPEKLIGDEIRTAQILLNIADNAVKFTPDGQVSILIGLVDDEHWHMAIRDTGRGIAEEDFERIFDEFRQLGTPGGTPTPGSGLGLSIARHLVRTMGGAIKIDSEIGKGSTFDVILPLQAAEKSHTQL
jgi:signal transduction histidine kinase